MTDFEATYSQYAEFQERMEHYWCLRWLAQDRVEEATATVDREGVVRFDRIPLRLRLADLPSLADGHAGARAHRPHRPARGDARSALRGVREGSGTGSGS